VTLKNRTLNLKAVQATGSKDPDIVMAKMREIHIAQDAPIDTQPAVRRHEVVDGQSL